MPREYPIVQTYSKPQTVPGCSFRYICRFTTPVLKGWVWCNDPEGARRTAREYCQNHGIPLSMIEIREPKRRK